MNSRQLINKYLEALEKELPKYSVQDWYKTFLGNKHRFYSGTKSLLLKLEGKESHFLPKSKLKLFFESYIFLLSFGKRLFLIKRKEKAAKLILSSLAGVNILKTFSYDRCFKNAKFIDPILGELQYFLKSKGQQVIILHENEGSFKKYYEHEVNETIIINIFAFVTWRDYFLQYFQLNINLLKYIFKSNIKYSESISDFIHQNFLEESLSPQFYHHAFHYSAFKSLLKQKNIEKIYSTFENNAWEKMLLFAKRDIGSSCHIISHQHVPIAPCALNYYLLNNESEILPDRIVTIGKASMSFLLSLNYPESTVRVGCALRLKLTKHELTIMPNRTSLVALDGTHQASVVLNTIMKFSDFFTSLNWNFIVRFHPAYGTESMAPYLSNKLDSFNIFRISNSSLEEDIKKVDSVFYWGSTVAFEALYSGRAVLHIPGNEVLSNDPIQLNGGLHFIATDLMKTINLLLNMSPEEFEERRKVSIEYCEDCVVQVNNETLKNFE